MKQFKLLLSMFLIVMLTSCQKDDYVSHYSNGEIITKELSLQSIREVVVDSKSTVIFKQAKQQKVSLSISENIFNDVNTSVVNGKWLIDFKDDGIATYNNHAFVVTIESPQIDKIQMESSGQISSDGVLQYENLKIKHFSSGSVTLHLNSNNLNIHMDGSGNLSLQGNSEKTQITHDSSGEVQAFNLIMKECNIRHDGSGDSKITVLEKLISTLDGSGDVYYKGQPTIINSEEGSGRLINAN